MHRTRTPQRRTGFSVSQPANIDLSNAASQAGCVLFATLPGEVRAAIFAHSLTPYDDPARPYAPDRIYCRPGARFHARTDISLLRTCKRVFAEARYAPVAMATHTFWVFCGPWRMMRAEALGMGRWDLWQASLSSAQCAAVRDVHIYAQQYLLEGIGQPSMVPALRFAAPNLRLTLRHSDWWSWQSPPESNDRLGICPWLPGRVSQQKMLAQPVQIAYDEMRALMVEGTWGWQVSQVKDLDRLDIEFETDVAKREQLGKVLERARHWVFPLATRNATLVQCGPVVDYTWEGPADLKDDSQAPLRPVQSRPQDNGDVPRRVYYVATVTWRAIPEDSEQYAAHTAARLKLRDDSMCRS